jgi:hypothetical protein
MSRPHASWSSPGRLGDQKEQQRATYRVDVARDARPGLCLPELVRAFAVRPETGAPDLYRVSGTTVTGHAA